MNSVKESSIEILDSIRSALEAIDPSQVEDMLNTLVITKARGNKVLIVGVGRSGLVGRAFAMRLMHLGFDVYVLGETITPAMGKGDLVIVISGSGSTTIPVTAAAIAKKANAKVLAITSFPDSSLGKMAEKIVVIRGRRREPREVDEYFSRQLLGEHEPLAPLGTIFEDTCMIFLDAVVVELMKRLETSEAEMRAKHATIE
ncbi:6-phospho-3-hexuloisomerase [Candidatus Bathyarchaeota archaeon]|nr:6-phospho-3-hexuloisomerase [Candidatus Bathyarchaeota archaeon]MBS7627459.1 6-phospho-3-hexuloisomerase [Candidatus Bathyarchaeota archaeon]